MTIHQQITKKRKELGWSASRLAKESGVDVSTISRMENEKRKSSEIFEKMADAMGYQWTLKEK